MAENLVIYASIVRPYVIGARIQLQRYVDAQYYCKHDPVGGVMMCTYECSSLFEHLNTISKYLQMCKIPHKDAQLFHDIRDHLRHDIRENLDTETTSKARRAAALGLSPELQMELSFQDDGFKLGATEVKTIQIAAYINFAEAAFNTLMAGGEVEEKEAQRP